MEFYYYLPILLITAGATFAGVRKYLRERRDLKRRQALKQQK
jgi:hypothetical protein